MWCESGFTLYVKGWQISVFGKKHFSKNCLQSFLQLLFIGHSQQHWRISQQPCWTIVIPLNSYFTCALHFTHQITFKCHVSYIYNRLHFLPKAIKCPHFYIFAHLDVWTLSVILRYIEPRSYVLIGHLRKLSSVHDHYHRINNSFGWRKYSNSTH